MTTPGGVPNLPLGALTVETLGQQLQDMSAAAMRQRAGQRFPDIFNISTGGNVLSDLTPFGILTRIWSEINALIAASSPNDITGPEDLPPLLVDFVENLPFVGQFIQLLQALLGVYDGTDETLLQIQELFTPIRGLLQAIIGQYEGDDPVLQGIEVLFIQLRTIVEKFLELTGGNLAAVTDKIPVVGDIVTAITGVVVDGNSPIDETFNVLKGWANDLPTIPTLVSVLTGQPADPAAPPGLPALQNWANNILTKTTPVPATNLFGQLPPAAIPSIPVAHINTEAPNLLSQGSFNTPGTISAAEGWSWDDSQNRTQGGGGSAKVTCNGTDRRLYSSQTIPVAAGDKIELSAAIKVSGFTGAQGSVNIAIIPFIGSQPQPTIIAGQASTANLTAAASEWVGIGTASPITMNAGVTSIKVRLAVTSAATAGTVWFDSVQCNKAGLLDQAKVTDLPNAWNFIYQGAQGIDPEAIVTGKTVFDLVGALSNPTSLAQTVTNNFGLLQDILNTDPGQVLGVKPVDGGQPLGLGAALADGNLTFEEAFTVLGNAAAGTADTISKALAGDFSGINNFFNNLLGVFHVSTTAEKNSVTNADNIQETARAIYNGYFGVGGSGQIAEVEATVAAIKTQIFKGYTLESLTYTGSGGVWTRPWENPQVSALLHGDGSNNSTTITDSSPVAANWTAAGNAKISTAQSKFGTGSISFDGSNGTWITPSAQIPAFGTDDFTIEFFARFNSTSDQTLCDFRPTSTNGAYPTISLVNGKVVYYTNTDFRITGTTSVSTGVWYHVALCRSGSSTKLFINGTQEGSTYTDTTDYLCPASRPIVGNTGFTANAAPFNGYIDELRITKSKARYTSNFTPPSAPFTADPSPAVPSEFYVVAFGSGGGGSPGVQQTTNNQSGVSTPGGSGGAPGGYISVEVAPAEIPARVTYQVAAGGNGGTKNATAVGSAQSSFGSYALTQSGQYFVQDIRGYYTTNQSAPGAGGTGGNGNGPQSGTAGGTSQLAAGGAGGSGRGATPYNAATAGVNGAQAPLDQKARAGGGGGGGGGATDSIRSAGVYALTSTTVPPAAGLGGNGGFPGGGGGGGGGALTIDTADGSAGIPAGNGGAGNNGVIILLWR